MWPGAAARWNGRASLGSPVADPLLGLSYPCDRIGQYHTLAGAEAARQESLDFAGEHCSRDDQGYMEGAAVEGLRAARAVLADLGRVWARGA